MDGAAANAEIKSQWRTSRVTGEFASSEVETRYKRHKKQSDDRQAYLSIIVTALIFASFFIADFRSLTDQTNLVIFGCLRGIAVLVGAGAAFLIWRGVGFFQRDLLVAGFALVVFTVTSIGAYVLERQPIELAPTALVMILGVFFFLPNRFSLMLFSAIYGAVSFFGVSQVYLDSTSRNGAILTGLIIVAVIIGALATVRLKRLQRLDFVNFIQVSELNSSLRQANKELADEVIERKRVEQKLMEAKEVAENANLAKSRFIAAASHDLRQPLQAVTLLVSALQNYLTRGGEEMQSKGLQAVNSLENSVKGLNTLLNALLDISKLEATLEDTNITSFPVQNLLDGFETSYREICDEKGLQLKIVANSSSIISSPILLKRALDNVISNAVKYTEKGRVLIGCRRQGDLLKIEVWDTGIGIAPEDLDKIFDEFHQLDNPARQSEKGFGLGLSIVKRTADTLKHSLDVRSVKGKGSVFSLTVPRLKK